MRTGAQIAIIVMCVSTVAATSLGEVVVFDDFDDGVLDPSWVVDFDTNASGWTSFESGTLFSVTDISPVTTGEWSIVTLSQSFQSLSDFTVDWDFQWGSAGQNSAMQKLRLSLFSGDDMVAVVAYDDPWIDHRGRKSIGIFSDTRVLYNSGADTMPYAGSAHVEIVRTNDVISISWNDVQHLTGTYAAPIDRVDIEFFYWSTVANGGQSSFFGSESIDMVSIDGVPTWPTPEPATMSLLAIGGLALLRRKSRGR